MAVQGGRGIGMHGRATAEQQRCDGKAWGVERMRFFFWVRGLNVGTSYVARSLTPPLPQCDASDMPNPSLLLTQLSAHLRERAEKGEEAWRAVEGTGVAYNASTPGCVVLRVIDNEHDVVYEVEGASWDALR
jgi:hypothetical protein